MSEVLDRDYFTDYEILREPYSYFEKMRNIAPVVKVAGRDVVVVTGFEETLRVLLDNEHYSAFRNATPTVPLPFEPQGDDIRAQIDAHRGKDPRVDLLVTYDGKPHADGRSLLTVLFTPARLAANEAYMVQLADKLIGQAVANGGCEVVSELGKPFSTLVIADLLGIPPEDRQRFREIIDAQPPAGNIDASDSREVGVHRAFIADFVYDYVADRRKNPRDDVLSELANATYRDGSVPETQDVVNIATFLFTAGQDTVVKLLGNSLIILSDNDDLQNALRTDRGLIPGFIEEALRFEGSTKSTFRYVSQSTELGGLQLPAGTLVIVSLAGANRDPARWDDPNAFKLDRPRIQEHVAFSRGAHTCIGAPLARAEMQILLNGLFDHSSWISLDSDRHGPPGARTFSYEASCIMRGCEQVHVKLASN